MTRSSIIAILGVAVLAVKPALAITAEDVINGFFRGWKLQNRTIMERYSMRVISTTGTDILEVYLRDYSIEWIERYRTHYVAKITARTISLGKGMETRAVYWIMKKVNGQWTLLQGYIDPLEGKKLSSRQIYMLYTRYR